MERRIVGDKLVPIFEVQPLAGNRTSAKLLMFIGEAAFEKGSSPSRLVFDSAEWQRNERFFAFKNLACSGKGGAGRGFRI